MSLARIESDHIDPADLDEMIDLTEKLIHLFHAIEKNEGSVLAKDYEEIFRILHNLKGSCAMLGLEKCAESIHFAEEKWLNCKEAHKLDVGLIDYFIKFSSHLQNAFQDRSFDPHPEALGQCFNCLAKNSFQSRCETHPQHTHKPEDAKVKVVVVSKDKDPRALELLEEMKYEYSTYDCPNKLYKNKEDILKANVVLISDDLYNVSPFPFIKVLNIVNNKCLPILLRNTGPFKEEVQEFCDRISYFSFGCNSRNCIDKLRQIFQMIKNII